MLEAVNSVLSNASYTKAVAEQTSVATSYAANPDRVQQVSTQAPYTSLYIKVDVNFDKAVLQLRDVDTGDVVQQIPTETQLEAYRRAQSSNSVRPATLEPEDNGGDVVSISLPDQQSGSEAASVATATSSTTTGTSTTQNAAPAQQPSPTVTVDTQA